MFLDTPKEIINLIADLLDSPSKLSLSRSCKRLFYISVFDIRSKEYSKKCAKDGYLSLVEYFNFRMNVEECRMIAAENGRLDFFIWTQNSPLTGPIPPTACLNTAVKGGHWNIANWCIEHHTQYDVESLLLTTRYHGYNALRKISSNGGLVKRTILKNRDEFMTAALLSCNEHTIARMRKLECKVSYNVAMVTILECDDIKPIEYLCKDAPGIEWKEYIRYGIVKEKLWLITWMVTEGYWELSSVLSRCHGAKNERLLLELNKYYGIDIEEKKGRRTLSD